jgi:hypothetical protein
MPVTHIDEQLAAGGGRRVHWLPTTRLGKWAVALAAGLFVLEPLWMVLPGGGALGLLSGFAGGVVALVAITRKHERAILVFAALVPFALALAFVLAELFVGHE